MSSILKEYKPALIFLVIFISVYLLLNTLYGLYITYHLPDADPVTRVVTRQVAATLGIFHDQVTTIPITGFGYVSLLLSGRVVVNVFEGCNSINVMIVFISFLLAFRGSMRLTLYFALGGLAIIYVMNLLRVGLLFEIALNFPDQLYLFHKFLFTGFIYAVVFVIWYFWIRAVKNDNRATT